MGRRRAAGDYAGGTAYGMLDAHPHSRHWRQVGSLVLDGIAVTRGWVMSRRDGRHQLKRTIVADQHSTAKTKKNKSHKHKDSKDVNAQKQGKRGKPGKHRASKEVQEPAQPLLHATAEPPSSNAVGTAAGGGGRWVRVPN